MFGVAKVNQVRIGKPQRGNGSTSSSMLPKTKKKDLISAFHGNRNNFKRLQELNEIAYKNLACCLAHGRTLQALDSLASPLSFLVFFLL